MAIRINDDLENILSTAVNTRRAELFVLSKLANNPTPYGDLDSANSTSWRNEIAIFLKSNQDLAYQIKQSLLFQMVPAEKFKWITNSRRQRLWIENYIQRNRHLLNGQLPKTACCSSESERILAFLDVYLTRYVRDAAIQEMESLEFHWQAHSRGDFHFDWLTGGDEPEKRGFFDKWLRSKGYINSFTPQFTTYEDILIAFDNIKISAIEIRILSRDAKNIWTQRVRRAKKEDEKQFNIVLSTRTIAALNKIAKKHGLTNKEVVDLLITSEYVDDIHIRNRLHRKEVLTASALK